MSNLLPLNVQLPKSANLFDTLPDELLTRIFTIGCDVDIANIALNHLTMWGYERRRRYPSITPIALVCKRFYAITKMRSNTQFYFIIPKLLSGVRDRRGTRRDFAVDMTQLLVDLRSSKGCDIHLHIFTDGDVSMRLAIYVLKISGTYKHQLTSIFIYSNYITDSTLQWIAQWTRFLPRLRHLLVDALIRPRGSISTTASIFIPDESHELSNPVTPLSLGNLHLAGEVANNMVAFASATDSLETLRLDPISPTLAELRLISIVIKSIPTLRRLECTILSHSKRQPTGDHSPSTIMLTSLAIVLDSYTLDIFFHLFSFPNLREADILVLRDDHAVSPREPELPKATEFALPNLITLGLCEMASAHISFLENCRMPRLDLLAIRTGASWSTLASNCLESRHSSPSTVVIGLGPGLSLSNQLKPLNLSKTAILEIWIATDLQEFPLDIPPSQERRVIFPELDTIHIFGIDEPIEAAVQWLLFSIELHRDFTIVFNDVITLAFNEPSRANHPSESPATMASLELLSARVHQILPRGDLLSNFEVWASKLKYFVEDEDRESIHNWTTYFDRADTRRLTRPNTDDCWLPIFSQLSLMVISFDIAWALDESFLMWIRLLYTERHGDYSYQGFPLPRLDTLKLQLKFPYHDSKHRYLLEESESMMRARLAAGLPLQLVEIWEILRGPNEPRRVGRITLQEL